jgi:hypothetical protein
VSGSHQPLLITFCQDLPCSPWHREAWSAPLLVQHSQILQSGAERFSLASPHPQAGSLHHCCRARDYTSAWPEGPGLLSLPSHLWKPVLWAGWAGTRVITTQCSQWATSGAGLLRPSPQLMAAWPRSLATLGWRTGEGTMLPPIHFSQAKPQSLIGLCGRGSPCLLGSCLGVQFLREREGIRAVGCGWNATDLCFYEIW